MSSCVATLYAALSMEEQTKEAIIRILHARAADVPLREIIDIVSTELAVTRATVKAAIWQLYADGMLQLTSEWDVRASEPELEPAVR